MAIEIDEKVSKAADSEKKRKIKITFQYVEIFRGCARDPIVYYKKKSCWNNCSRIDELNRN